VARQQQLLGMMKLEARTGAAARRPLLPPIARRRAAWEGPERAAQGTQEEGLLLHSNRETAVAGAAHAEREGCTAAPGVTSQRILTPAPKLKQRWGQVRQLLAQLATAARRALPQQQVGRVGHRYAPFYEGLPRGLCLMHGVGLARRGGTHAVEQDGAMLCALRFQAACSALYSAERAHPIHTWRRHTWQRCGQRTLLRLSGWSGTSNARPRMTVNLTQ
jgi:hypothetical protein